MKKNRLLIIIFGCLALIAITAGLTAYTVKKSSINDQAASLSAVKRNVSKLMVLPRNEEPSLAIVEDEKALSDKFLKQNAKRNDQLLIFSSSGQAILYRPSINKIVAVTNITVDAAQAQADGATIAIRNGTADAELANELKNELSKKYPSAKVSTEKANRSNYEKTTVIDTGATKDDLFVQIIDLLNASRGVVPLGEAKASADIVIIIGKDYLDAKRI